jgi:hypothetical protein
LLRWSEAVISKLAFADHVGCFDLGKFCNCRVKRIKALQRSDDPLGEAII